MEKAKVLTTDAEIDAWLEECSKLPPQPVVKQVEFLRQARILLLHMSDGRRLPLPVEDVEELAYATDDQLSKFQIEGGGLLVHFPDFDGNLDVPFLAAGGRGGAEWMAQLEVKRAAVMTAAA